MTRPALASERPVGAASAITWSGRGFAVFIAVSVNVALFLALEWIVDRPAAVDREHIDRFALDRLRWEDVPRPELIEPEPLLEAPEPEERPRFEPLALAPLDAAPLPSIEMAPLAPAFEAPVVEAAVLPGLVAVVAGDARFSGTARLRRTMTSRPDYPERARSRGIEGHVVVEFSVRPDGRNEDIRILEAKPARVFNRSCLSFVRRERLYDGTPAPGERLTFTCRYEMGG